MVRIRESETVEKGGVVVTAPSCEILPVSHRSYENAKTNLMTNTDTPRLYTLQQATRDRGLVGEKCSVLTVFLATISGGLLIMDGPSRSGKDEITDGAFYLLEDPELSENEDSDLIYKWPASSSAKAPYYKHRLINQTEIQRFPDFVSMGDSMESILKSFGEGVPATHEKVDVSKSDAMGPENQLEDMKLEPPRCLIAFIASDNEKIDLNDIAETRNRAFIITADSSEELTRRVNRRQVEMRDGTYEQRVNDERLDEIRQYNANIPIKKYTESSAGSIMNLVAGGIQDQEPIPPKFVEARSDVPRLLDFIEAVTLYHHEDRMEVTSEYPQKLLVTPADGWMGFKIFGERIVMSALNLRDLDRVLLNYLRDRPNQKYSAMDIQKAAQERGHHVSVSDIRRSLENMIYKMYIERHEDSPVTYSASAFGQSVDVASQAKLDWEHVVEKAKAKARDNLSPEDAEAYISEHCEGDGLIVTHPISGETVNILEDTEFEEELEAAEKRLAGEVEESPWTDVRHQYNGDSDRATTDGGKNANDY